jgi:hypothetical protein
LATFDVPQPRKLTQGQVEGLCREALEAYLFGQRTRYDANGRLWNMRRATINDLWQVELSVSLGGVLLCEGAIPLDRLPSADGEHQLIALVEYMAGAAGDAHEKLHDEQVKWRKAHEHSALPDSKANEPPGPKRATDTDDLQQGDLQQGEHRGEHRDDTHDRRLKQPNENEHDSRRRG